MEAFAPLYHSYSRLVASIAARFPLSPQEREEVCQDVFLTIWEKKTQLIHENAVTSWIRTVTRHRCLSELRRMRPTIALEEVHEGALAWDMPSFTWEQSLQLLQVLIDEHQSPVRRRVAQLFYREGQSVATIAAIMEMSPNTVLSHLRRFRLIVEKSLLRLMEEKGLDPTSA